MVTDEWAGDLSHVLTARGFVFYPGDLVKKDVDTKVFPKRLGIVLEKSRTTGHGIYVLWSHEPADSL